jgi:SHS2 domain-containing protein
MSAFSHVEGAVADTGQGILMVDDTTGDRPLGGPESGGHRAVPHTADTRIEAWGPTRERCLAEAMLGLVECFADVTGARPTGVRQMRIAQGADADLLADMLDEVIFRLDVHGEVPMDIEVEADDEGVDARLVVTDVAAVQITGAIPKAVSLSELRLSRGACGWSCAATVDV